MLGGSRDKGGGYVRYIIDARSRDALAYGGINIGQGNIRSKNMNNGIGSLLQSTELLRDIRTRYPRGPSLGDDFFHHRDQQKATREGARCVHAGHPSPEA